MGEDQDWLAYSSVRALVSAVRFTASARKNRLFAVAALRRIWRLLTDDRQRAVVEVCERCADGRASPEEMKGARQTAESILADAEAVSSASWQAYRALHPEAGLPFEGGGVPNSFVAEWCSDQSVTYFDPALGRRIETDQSKAARRGFKTSYARFVISRAVLLATRPDRVMSPTKVAEAVCEAVDTSANVDKRKYAHGSVSQAEMAAQCDLFRDVFRGPGRAVRLKRVWLAWNDRTVPKLAAAAYEGRAFDRLPILADALEDAGCGAAELLTHLRGLGPHVRGCWALDLLLGKG